MNIGTAIRTLRASAGLKQHELAARAHLTGAAVSLIESGRRDPSLKSLAAIADALQIPGSVLVAVALADAHPKQTPGEVDKLLEPLVEAARRMVVVNKMRDEGRTHASTDDKRRHRRRRAS
jgi:transcriptional regulator with XRE-family HTH domain